MTTFVLVGGGQASATAARTLREEGFDGRIVLIGDEPSVPYERPPLSKEFLQGEAEREDLPFEGADWYAEHAVELELGTRVVSLSPSSRTVRLGDNRSLQADAVLLATGGRPRRLPGHPGSQRVLYLRTVEDAVRLRDRLDGGRRLVVVGAGFIGSEVAASARTRGCEVTMLEALDVPLERVLGHEMGSVCAAIHRDEGVDLRTGEGVESIEEDGDGVRVRTTGGAVVEGDAVVVGIGIEPNVEVAQTAGIEIRNGILVDAVCRTSVAGVFAAGDVANHLHPLFRQRVRVEHFDNAEKQGEAVARSMLGDPAPFDDPHWFWSDQYDYNLQYAGHATEWDALVIRGSVDERDFTAFYLLGGQLRAAFAIERGGDVFVAKLLIAAEARPDPARLRDEDVDLEDLLEGS